MAGEGCARDDDDLPLAARPPDAVVGGGGVRSRGPRRNDRAPRALRMTRSPGSRSEVCGRGGERVGKAEEIVR